MATTPQSTTMKNTTPKGRRVIPQNSTYDLKLVKFPKLSDKEHFLFTAKTEEGLPLIGWISLLPSQTEGKKSTSTKVSEHKFGKSKETFS